MGSLLGDHDANLRLIENELDVVIVPRDERLQIYGDTEQARTAAELLGNVVRASDVFETEPIGGPDAQDAYLNMVAVVDTSLDPFAFLRRCQRIEQLARRERIVHWGPRTLDVDLLFYDDVTIESPELHVPHPRIGERRFVLAPLWPDSVGFIVAVVVMSIGNGLGASVELGTPSRLGARLGFLVVQAFQEHVG